MDMCRPFSALDYSSKRKQVAVRPLHKEFGTSLICTATRYWTAEVGSCLPGMEKFTRGLAEDNFTKRPVNCAQTCLENYLLMTNRLITTKLSFEVVSWQLPILKLRLHGYHARKPYSAAGSHCFTVLWRRLHSHGSLGSLLGGTELRDTNLRTTHVPRQTLSL